MYYAVAVTLRVADWTSLNTSGATRIDKYRYIETYIHR